MDTLILRDDLFLEHDPGPGHPENAGRLRPLLASLDADPIAGTRSAAPTRAARSDLLRVHGEAYVRALESVAGRRVQLDADTSTSERSWECALAGAGAVLDGVRAVLDGHAHGACALVRPPGHHAEPSRAMGFCLLNNVAIAAAAAIAEGGLSRVLVLDPDVHHGNGTQDAFRRRGDVLYVSSHRFPFYPGTGALHDVGEGDGTGRTLNLPLDAGLTDAELLHLYATAVEPVVDAFRPELIVVSAGFDVWKDDPLGGMAITADGFAALYALFARWAARHCPGRLVLALEGGYDPAGVTAGVRAALRALTGADAGPRGFDAPISRSVQDVVARSRRVMSASWPGLRA
ncbi:MAG: histone deacetylase [Planctomycetes bacterium]|nr:histone deacetylase [Planctomycetota bacterium]